MAADEQGRQRTHRIAVMDGDGIGPEVVPEAVATLREIERTTPGLTLEIEEFDWSSARYFREGAVMPADGYERLTAFDAILVGPYGDARIPDSIVLWQSIIGIRQRFDQYVNLRPVKMMPGVQGRLRDLDAADLDIIFVRENTEGEYTGAGGRVHAGLLSELAIETAVFTREGVERVVRYAFEYARSHDRAHVTSATKSNAQRHSMVFWDEVFEEVAADYPEFTHDSCLIDALCARLVTSPESLDVVVCSNLFGDILTDLGAALVGSIGIAPSANLDPARRNPSLFQAIHGSAPDIAGQGIANPVGEIWSAAMLLEFLGESDGACRVMGGIEASLSAPETRTRDLDGSASTRQVGEAVRTAVRNDTEAASHV